MSRHVVRPLVVLVALAGCACVINVDADQVTVREEKQFKAGPGTELTLDTFDGSIQVQTWDRPEVVIEIQKQAPDREEAAALDVRATQEGNHIRVEAPSPKVRRGTIGINVVSTNVSYVVRMPPHVKLTATTRDGSISVENVDAAVNLRSGDGSIRIAHVTGTTTAHTEDGSISAVDVSGSVSLESGDGSVQVDGRLDHLHIRTGDGSVVVEAKDGSAVADNWNVTTGDGSITLRVPRGLNAEVDADSRDGRIRTDIEGLPAAEGEDGGTLRGRIGSGGRTITLRTGDGTIALLDRRR